MSILNKTIYLSILTAMVVVGSLLSVNPVLANGNILIEIWDKEGGCTPYDEVCFENLAGNPIFNVSNFLPGDTETERLRVTNNTSESQTVGLNVADGFDRGCVTLDVQEYCLADELILTVTEIDSGFSYSASLTDFYNEGMINITDLTKSGGAKDNAEYDFSVHFKKEAAAKEYHGSSTSFDLEIGFFSKETVSEEPASGGGGYVPPLSGVVKNIIIVGSPTLTDTDATIECETEGDSGSILSQCRIIYDIIPHPSLGTPPDYGYEWSTDPTSLPKKFSHTIPLTNLEPETTYYYRVVCWASPKRISSEHTFTTLEVEEGTEETGEGAEGAEEGAGEGEGFSEGQDGSEAGEGSSEKLAQGTGETEGGTAAPSTPPYAGDEEGLPSGEGDLHGEETTPSDEDAISEGEGFISRLAANLSAIWKEISQSSLLLILLILSLIILTLIGLKQWRLYKLKKKQRV